MSEISKKESMTKEFDRDLYWEFFHDDMLSLKNMTGIDFTREN